MKKHVCLFALISFLFALSCKKDSLQNEPFTTLDTITTGSNPTEVSSGFDVENSCIDQIPAAFVNLPQRAIAKAVYDQAVGWHSGFATYGKPIWEGTITGADSMSIEFINFVPLVDDTVNSVKSLFVVQIKQGAFTYFFLNRNYFEEHPDDIFQYEFEGQLASLTAYDVLDLVNEFDHVLYCAVGLRDDESSCFNFGSNWWDRVVRGSKKIFNWIGNIFFTGPGGDDAPPGSDAGGGSPFGTGTMPIGGGTWTNSGGGATGGSIFSNEDIINNYETMICQWYELYDGGNGEVTVNQLPGDEYDPLQELRCEAIAVLENGANPMEPEVLADLLENIDILDSELANWIIANGNPLSEIKLAAVTAYVQMTINEQTNLPWRDFNPKYFWFYDTFVPANGLTQTEAENFFAGIIEVMNVAEMKDNTDFQSIAQLGIDNQC